MSSFPTTTQPHQSKAFLQRKVATILTNNPTACLSNPQIYESLQQYSGILTQSAPGSTTTSSTLLPSSVIQERLERSTLEISKQTLAALAPLFATSGALCAKVNELGKTYHTASEELGSLQSAHQHNTALTRALTSKQSHIRSKLHIAQTAACAFGLNDVETRVLDGNVTVESRLCEEARLFWTQHHTQHNTRSKGGDTSPAVDSLLLSTTDTLPHLLSSLTRLRGLLTRCTDTLRSWAEAQVRTLTSDTHEHHNMLPLVLALLVRPLGGVGGGVCRSRGTSTTTVATTSPSDSSRGHEHIDASLSGSVLSTCIEDFISARTLALTKTVVATLQEAPSVITNTDTNTNAKQVSQSAIVSDCMRVATVANDVLAMVHQHILLEHSFIHTLFNKHTHPFSRAVLDILCDTSLKSDMCGVGVFDVECVVDLMLTQPQHTYIHTLLQRVKTHTFVPPHTRAVRFADVDVCVLLGAVTTSLNRPLLARVQRWFNTLTTNTFTPVPINQSPMDPLDQPLLSPRVQSGTALTVLCLLYSTVNKLAFQAASIALLSVSESNNTNTNTLTLTNTNTPTNTLAPVYTYHPSALVSSLSHVVLQLKQHTLQSMVAHVLHHHQHITQKLRTSSSSSSSSSSTSTSPTSSSSDVLVLDASLSTADEYQSLFNDLHTLITTILATPSLRRQDNPSPTLALKLASLPFEVTTDQQELSQLVGLYSSHALSCLQTLTDHAVCLQHNSTLPLTPGQKAVVCVNVLSSFQSTLTPYRHMLEQSMKVTSIKVQTLLKVIANEQHVSLLQHYHLHHVIGQCGGWLSATQRSDQLMTAYLQEININPTSTTAVMPRPPPFLKAVKGMDVDSVKAALTSFASAMYQVNPRGPPLELPLINLIASKQLRSVITASAHRGLVSQYHMVKTVLCHQQSGYNVKTSTDGASSDAIPLEQMMPLSVSKLAHILGVDAPE